MNSLVKHHSKISEVEQKALLRLFGKMDLRQREEITDLKISIFRTTNEDFIGIGYSHERRDHASLILAISKHKADISALERKGNIDPRDLERVRKFRELEVKKRKDRKAPRAKYIQTNLMSTIMIARQKSLSWRQISILVAKQHKKKISHTYLRAIYEQNQPLPEQKPVKEIQNDQN